MISKQKSLSTFADFLKNKHLFERKFTVKYSLRYRWSRAYLGLPNLFTYSVIADIPPLIEVALSKGIYFIDALKMNRIL